MKSDIPRSGVSPKRWLPLCAAGALGVTLVAISSRSLWIDETLTAVKAAQPTFGEWWRAMVQEKASDLQMPLYMAYVWAYEKLFGSGEWALRFANAPWFICGAVALVAAFLEEIRIRLAVTFVTLFSPFAWYYLDEARPYGMQLGASLLVLAALRGLSAGSAAGERRERRCVGLFLSGIIVLAGSSLLGMIWAAGALGAMLALFRRGRLAGLIDRHRRLWLLMGAGLAGLAAYYVWTIQVGARASGAATTGWASVCYIVYELLGLAGVGPGRLDIRNDGLVAFRPYWCWLALYAVAICGVVGAALRGISFTDGARPNSETREAGSGGWRDRLTGAVHLGGAGLNWPLVLCAVGPAAFILAAGVLKHFRVLGRHFTPVLPLVLLLFAFGLARLWSRRGAASKAVAVLFCLLTLWSCFAYRWASRHAKDDYRRAADFARSALRDGRRVWWNAAESGAQYYAVPLAAKVSANSPGAAVPLMNPTAEELSALPMPQVVIISKPDVYDGQIAVAHYVRARGFREVGQLTAFTIWQRE